MLCWFFCITQSNDGDGGQNQQESGKVQCSQRHLQEQHREYHGGHWLHRRQNTAGDAAHNAHTSLIKAESTYSADENNNDHIQIQCAVNGDSNGPGTEEQQQGNTADQHAPADYH